MKTALLLLALSCSSCAAIMGAPMVPEANNPYNPTGEIVFRNVGASFDEWRVRSPHMNLTKRTDGSWGGTVGDTGSSQAVDLTVTPKKISGVDFVMTLESQDDQNTVIVGQRQGRIMRFEFHPDVIEVRVPSFSLTFHKHGEDSWGPQGEMVVKGEAGKAPQPWPQIALAMVAAFD